MLDTRFDFNKAIYEKEVLNEASFIGGQNMNPLGLSSSRNPYSQGFTYKVLPLSFNLQQ